MKQTVAAYIAKTLESAGVKLIWGVTGDSLNGSATVLIAWAPSSGCPPAMKKWRRLPLALKHNFQENWRSVPDWCGPGNLHLINGLFDCHRNHVPVLAIAAHISSEIGSGYFQETHPQEGYPANVVTIASWFPARSRSHKCWQLLCAKRCLTVAFPLSCYRVTWR